MWTTCIDIHVDYVYELWQWQFDMYYNPDVLNGVYADEGTGATVGFDPDGFLASGGASINRAPGPEGWDNTLGKLWLASAFMVDKDKNVTGGGRLASIMFEVVGKGETNLTLGSLTLLFGDATIWPTLEHGYFRNVDSALIPTASFTYSPMGTPEPLEGYYTEFNGTDSTATGSKNIVEYKWYFWRDYSQRFVLDFDQPNKLRPDGDGTYTDWTNNWDDWNDTTASTYVYANADDMYESSTLQDHATEIYNVGKVNVTIVARADVPASDERVQIMLVIGGTKYYGKSYTVTITQTEYTSEWATNPATGSAWTWSDIDSLEAGVRSLQEGASWTGEIRVSQLYIEAFQTPIVDVDVDTIYQNITSSGTWNVTLTVTDDDGVVGSTTQEVTIKAHDLAVVDVIIDAPIAQWPSGNEYVDIGEIVTINVTVENQGDFAEQHSPSSNFTVTAHYQVTLGPGEIRRGIIGTVNVTTPLAAGARTNVTFQWDTNGNNATHPFEHFIHANVTTVEYEYELRDNLLEYSRRVRVRFHDVAITEIEVYPHRTLRPDGDGTFTEWTGTYADWDDWPEHNEDVDYISATADAMNESSTLEDHTIETWSIERVRVTVFARATSLPSEQLILMLVIGGEAYDATGESLTLSYSEYSYDWETNPATGSDWTWQDIDFLEVGVRSQAIGGWAGEIRVTQLYVEVSGAAPGPVSRGEITPVMVTVENEGDFNETAISVTAYYNGDAIDTQTIHLLTNSSFGSPPNFAIENYTVTLTFDWDTSGISLDEYTISANTSLIPDDYEPYDNTYVNGNIDVTAPPEPSTISIDASPTSVMVGEVVTVNGSITPVRAGATVTIWYRVRSILL
jgi:hypothetical protein